MATVTVPLSAEDKALLAEIAASQHRTKEDLAADALRRYLRFEEEQIRKIQDGVVAADRGEFATDEEIEAFFAEYSEPG